MIQRDVDQVQVGGAWLPAGDGRDVQLTDTADNPIQAATISG
ncbi:hypothetical protein [Micromonospora cremea]|nr:hypothetical protein [Micromonospora cremea]